MTTGWTTQSTPDRQQRVRVFKEVDLFPPIRPTAAPWATRSRAMGPNEAIYACAGGVAVIMSCERTDGPTATIRVSDGCEINLLTDPDNCGLRQPDPERRDQPRELRLFCWVGCHHDLRERGGRRQRSAQRWLRSQPARCDLSNRGSPGSNAIPANGTNHANYACSVAWPSSPVATTDGPTTPWSVTAAKSTCWTNPNHCSSG